MSGHPWHCPVCGQGGQYGGTAQLTLHVKVSHSGAPRIVETPAPVGHHGARPLTVTPREYAGTVAEHPATAQQSASLYWDSPVAWLIEHTAHGFIHPVSGDTLAIYRVRA